jgi:hypothetical protein
MEYFEEGKLILRSIKLTHIDRGVTEQCPGSKQKGHSDGCAFCSCIVFELFYKLGDRAYLPWALHSYICMWTLCPFLLWTLCHVSKTFELFRDTLN